MSGDIDQALADGNRWVVVDILHPTRRVCILTNEVDLYKSSYFSLSRSQESYSTKDEAIEKAREVRRNSSYFQDYDEFYDIAGYDSDSAEYSEDDEVEISYEERIAEDEPKLPWSSHVLSNRENDQENLIDVMTVKDYLNEVSRINAILKAEGKERETKEEKIRLATNTRIKEQGEVYYSFSFLRGIIDIPANFELLIKGGNIYQMPRKEQLERTVQSMNSFQLSKLSFCLSIQVQTCNVKFSERNKELLESIITNAPNLKELHWHGVNDLSRYISGDQGSSILRNAFNVLEVLSLPNGCVYPHDIVHLQSCSTALRRLDIRGSLSREEGVMSNIYDCYEKEREEDHTLPYTEPLISMIEHCRDLYFIDLEGAGNEDDEGKSIMDYAFDRNVLYIGRQNGVYIKLYEGEDENQH